MTRVGYRVAQSMQVQAGAALMGGSTRRTDATDARERAALQNVVGFDTIQRDTVMPTIQLVISEELMQRIDSYVLRLSAHYPQANISRSSLGRQLLEYGAAGIEQTLAQLDHDAHMRYLASLRKPAKRETIPVSFNTKGARKPAPKKPTRHR